MECDDSSQNAAPIQIGVAMTTTMTNHRNGLITMDYARVRRWRAGQCGVK